MSNLEAESVKKAFSDAQNPHTKLRFFNALVESLSTNSDTAKTLNLDLVESIAEAVKDPEAWSFHVPGLNVLRIIAEKYPHLLSFPTVKSVSGVFMHHLFEDDAIRYEPAGRAMRSCAKHRSDLFDSGWLDETTTYFRKNTELQPQMIPFVDQEFELFSILVETRPHIFNLPWIHAVKDGMLATAAKIEEDHALIEDKCYMPWEKLVLDTLDVLEDKRPELFQEADADRPLRRITASLLRNPQA